jgi:hypothetical protein
MSEPRIEVEATTGQLTIVTPAIVTAAAEHTSEAADPTCETARLFDDGAFRQLPGQMALDT